jgi:hypothetical protein
MSPAKRRAEAARKTKKKASKTGTRAKATRKARARATGTRGKTAKAAASAKKARAATKKAKATRRATTSSPTAQEARATQRLRELEQRLGERERECQRLRAKADELLHQLERAQATITQLRTRLEGPDQELDLDLDEDLAYDEDTHGGAGLVEGRTSMSYLESRRRELDRIRLEQERDFEDQPFWNICPHCGEPLEESEFGGIKADRCEACGGIYFDRGELELLLSLKPATEVLARLQGLLTS